ncbi:MAG: hypothetical protein MZV65_02325 [Chromatiales bacterium]|nr:hypothetical protein [Chromatiales bacterium]
MTLEDIAGFIRAGREVQIIDLKSGDDLTRQYLLQIIAEHESKGDNVLPLGVLTDLVRSYTTEVQSVVPQFLAASFEMLRTGQTKMLENFTQMPNPMVGMPGFDVMRKQQEAFIKTMMGLQGWNAANAEKGEQPVAAAGSAEELAQIRKQLADLQKKLSKPDPAAARSRSILMQNAPAAEPRGVLLSRADPAQATSAKTFFGAARGAELVEHLVHLRLPS